jgi:YbbR domain-containing protein
MLNSFFCNLVPVKESLPLKKNEKMIKAFRLNRKVATFIICLLIALFFWFLMTLSKEYSVVFTFPVSYSNLPADKVLSNQLPESIDIEVKSKGFNILMYKLKRNQKQLFIYVKSAKPTAQKNNFYILTASEIEKIKYQFPSSISLIKINPDTIYLNFNKKESKLVPVVHNIKLNFNKQFQLIDSVKILPSLVEISGAADVINSISKIETIPVELNDISKSLLINLEVKRDKKNENIEVTPSEIKAQINVAKYTEATIMVPVETQNVPADYTLKTFPDNVTIKYSVAFEDYEKIQASQFKVIVDYKKTDANSNKLKLQLVGFPKQAKSIKIDPEKVEYIIRKN